jgi:hypothetical protein
LGKINAKIRCLKNNRKQVKKDAAQEKNACISTFMQAFSIRFPERIRYKLAPFIFRYRSDLSAFAFSPRRPIFRKLCLRLSPQLRP